MSLDQYYTVSCLIRNTCINLKLKIVLVRVRSAHQKLHVFFNVCICADVYVQRTQEQEFQKQNVPQYIGIIHFSKIV